MSPLRPSLLLVPLLAGAALPQGEAVPAGPAADQAAVTHHEIALGDRMVPYEATAGTYVLRSEEGDPKATLFYVAYRREDIRDVARRPLTFCFNGGPGSSSVWLHMGAFGPKRVLMAPDGQALPPPYRLVDNEATLLDVTDLVFIDPVTTGYSRPAQGEDREQFHGVDGDARWVAEFIRLFTTRNERWASPKFLAGESYGTTRAARLSRLLQDEHGMFLNGVVLISSILQFQTARFDRGNDLPYALFLPSYAATAFYHGKLEPALQQDLQRTLELAEDFALGEYTLALAQGDRLTESARRHVATDLARFTGVSLDYALRSNLRLNIHRFTKELLRDERTTVGRLDSRFTGNDFDAAGETPEYDPSYSAIQGPYTAMLNDYLRRELGYESDLPYEILTDRVHPWKWGNENRYLNVAEDLRGALTKNPDLRVFVANGLFDLATPYFATRYTFDHLGLEPALRAHVRMGYYEAGHMMYIHGPSRAALKRDLAAFFDEALGPQRLGTW